MKEISLVALGGAVGSVLRYKVSLWCSTLYPLSTFPIGTFLVNLLGCFGIGVFSALSEKYGLGDPRLRLLLVTGFLGGFTTFSAFSVESVELIRRGEITVALSYILASLIMGLLAVILGYQCIPAKSLS